MESNTGASYGGSGAASSSTNTGGDVISGGGGGGAGLSNAVNIFDTNVELSLVGSTLSLKRPFNQVSDGLESVTSGANKLLKTKVDGSTVTLVSGVLTGGYIAGNGMNISGNTISSTFNNNSGATECVSVNADGTNTTLGVANLSAKTTTLNVGHSTATVNVRGSQINLGSTGDTVNIAGNLTYVNSTQTTIQDKAITLNKATFPTLSGAASESGIEIEEGILQGTAENIFSTMSGFYTQVNTSLYNTFISAPNGRQRFFITSFMGTNVVGVSLNTPYFFSYKDNPGGGYYNFNILDANGNQITAVTPAGFVWNMQYTYYSFSSTAAYVKTSADRNSWELKAPGKAGKLSFPMPDGDLTVGSIGTGSKTEIVLTTLPTLAATTVTYKASSGGASGSKTFTVTSASALGNVTAVQYGYFLYVQEQNVAGAALTGTGLGTPPVPNLCKSVTITGTDIAVELVTALTAQASGTYTLVSANSYTIPSSVNYIYVEMVGAGGGGGGGSTQFSYIGSGGGAGCYSRGKLNVTPGTTYYYSIGSGGVGTVSNTSTTTAAGYGRPTMFSNASMSQYMIVLGGEGGNTPIANSSLGPIGLGKNTSYVTAFTDVLTVGGGDGFASAALSSNALVGGNGGGSYFGGGGRGAQSNSGLEAAKSGVAYGSGGGGGRYSDIGANGAQGVLNINYFSNVVLSNTYTPADPLYLDGSELKIRSGKQTKQVLTGITTESQVATFSSGGVSGTSSVVVTVPAALNGLASVQTYTNQYVLFKKDGQTGTGVSGSILVTSAVTLSTGLTVTLTLATALSATASGTYTLQKVNAFTIPANVYSIVAESVGGGGGGGSAANSAYTGGGGAAGAYVQATLNVTPGQILYYSIGDGGAQQTTLSSAGNAGQSTTINYLSSSILSSHGKGGTSVGTSGNSYGIGGFGVLPIVVPSTVIESSTLIQGGDGLNGGIHIASSQYGPGGSGGASFFGQGGIGGTNLYVAGPGIAYGSGGGGGSSIDTLAREYGAKGAQGVIILTYLSNVALGNNYTPVAPLSFSGSNLLLRSAETNIRYYGTQSSKLSPDTVNSYTTMGTANFTTLINTASNNTIPFDTSTGRYTVPFTGMYLIHSYCNGQSVAPIANIRHYRGTSTSFKPWGEGIPSSSSNNNMNWVFYLQANDVIMITLSATGDIQNSDQVCSLCFKLLV